MNNKSFKPSIAKFIFNLAFQTVKPSPNPLEVSIDTPYSELEEVAIAFVSDLPPEIQTLVEQKKEIVEQQFFGEFEVITEYSIKPVHHNPDSYSITRYTNYQ